jgi:hypothetical protein
LAVVVGCALAAVSTAQMTPKATVETSETLFTVLAAMNACGYDQELGVSAPIREEVRTQVEQASQASEEAKRASAEICTFYEGHRQQDPTRELAQYVSLALTLGPPPSFTPTLKANEIPPDAAGLAGMIPLLQAFYERVGVHKIWEGKQAGYDALVERHHDPLTKLLFDTDLYVRLPISGYMGRRFVIVLEPMGAPGQVNARNYSSDYYVVLSPGRGAIKLEQIRHTYLHYILDPLTMKRPLAMQHLEPLLSSVTSAPMDEVFKKDISLLVTESLIRAIEARTLNGGKAPEPERLRTVQSAMEQGYILTRYLYDQLAKFEKGPAGLQDAFPDWLYNADIGRQKKEAEQTQFASSATPEVVRSAQKPRTPLLDKAEARLVAGDLTSARVLAEQALREQQGDQGRAFFILARTATMNKDMAGARTYFERTLGVSHEPAVLAWAHIYLGRIFDLQENREAAMGHYRAALQAGDSAPEVKAAAERGLKQPYEPPAHRN